MDTKSDLGETVRYGLVLAYDSDDAEFIRGAEVGSLAAKVSLLGDVAIHVIMRQANREMVRRIAKGADRSYSVEPVDETWMMVTIDPAGVSRG